MAWLKLLLKNYTCTHRAFTCGRSCTQRQQFCRRPLAGMGVTYNVGFSWDRLLTFLYAHYLVTCCWDMRLHIPGGSGGGSFARHGWAWHGTWQAGWRGEGTGSLGQGCVLNFPTQAFSRLPPLVATLPPHNILQAAATGPGPHPHQWFWTFQAGGSPNAGWFVAGNVLVPTAPPPARPLPFSPSLLPTMLAGACLYITASATTLFLGIFWKGRISL